MKDNVMMFLFHDKEFFSHLFTADEGPHLVRYGRLLKVDFRDYVKNKGQVTMTIDNEFDKNLDHIEKICLNSVDKMTCVLASGKIVVKTLDPRSSRSFTTITQLAIDVLEPLQEEYDDELDEEVDRDGPSLCCTGSGCETVFFGMFWNRIVYQKLLYFRNVSIVNYTRNGSSIKRPN